MVNPYESSVSTSSIPMRRTVSRERHFVLTACWCYPLVLIAAFYTAWLVAAMVLGHFPRPNLDDPLSIHFSVNLFYYSAGLLLIGFPSSAFLGLGLELYHQYRQPTPIAMRAFTVLLYGSIVVLAFLVLRWDPMLVMDWYMD